MFQQKFLKQLDKTLFWDVKIDDLDAGKNADFIIKRVLSLGDIKDYRILRKMYNFQKIKKAGIKGFKIEGRNREERYVDTVVRIYKKALDKKLTKNL